MTTTRLNVVISTSALATIKALAAAERVTVSAWIRRALEAQATAQGATLPYTPTPGGQRYSQCPRCGGWNVGRVGDMRSCADCGWQELESQR